MVMVMGSSALVEMESTLPSYINQLMFRILFHDFTINSCGSVKFSVPFLLFLYTNLL